MPAQKSTQAEPGRSDSYISTRVLADLAGIGPRAARLAIEQAMAGKLWRGIQLAVRRVRGRGGAAGEKFEVLCSSLPADLQARMFRQRPDAGTRELVADQVAQMEEERQPGKRKYRRRLNQPWTQEEREARHAAFSQLPTSTQNKAKKRLAAVQLFHSITGADVSEMQRYEIVSRETQTSASSIRSWVGQCKGLDSGDWLPALAPRHQGCQVRADISIDAWEHIRSDYFRLNKPALKPVYRRAQHLAEAHGWALPSYATVKRLIEAEPHAFRVLTREGQDAFEALHPFQERDYSTIGLHEIWCCDGRKADLFCRWPDGTVSRPIVIAWMEVRSRTILAYRIARTENAEAVRLAFKAAAEKSRAIPENNYLDNGRGFASKLLTGGSPTRFRFKVRDDDVLGIFNLLGIKTIWAKPYSGRSKPIESFWRQFAEAEKRCDGAYCGNSPDARPEDCDPAKAISIDEYSKLLDETLAGYHTRPHRGQAMNGRSPLAVYGEMLPLCQPRQPTREQLRLCLLAAEQVRLEPGSGAVRILGNRYWNEKVADLTRGRTYTVRFNPEDANEPISVFDGDKFICEVPITARTGFLDSDSAKTNERARRQYLKGQKQQANARRDMSKARSWGALPELPCALQEEISDLVLPNPKVVTPLRPERDYRAVKPEKPILSQDEFMEAVLSQPQRAANKG
ncbi:MAG: transposase domain-containing protein [Betaproteobacteria bacterium]